MPGWHEATREVRKGGKLRVIGIIEEQHPDRARLFLQWKEMEFPILVDSLNLLGVSAVPITLLVDEHGVIRDRLQRADAGAVKRIEDFVATDHPAPAEAPPKAVLPDPVAAAERAEEAAREEVAPWIDLGDALFLTSDDGEHDARDLDAAIDAYSAALDRENVPEARFRLGVALRRRFETAARRPGDFQAAAKAWGDALALRPNQYIWRRRIEQYGPRLAKPYSFYDWVREARDEIRARGDEPAKLAVEPEGAELAYPVREFPGAAESGGEPDAGGEIARDSNGLVRAEITVVPANAKPGESVRVHLTFRPRRTTGAHWNNEGAPLVVWVDPPQGATVDQRRLGAKNAAAATSDEERRVELEVRVPEDAPRDRVRIPAYVLYSVCTDEDAVCRFLRQDLEIEVPVRGGK